MLVADVWPAVGGVAALAAAAAAGVAIIYARRTVTQSAKARKDAQDAHQEAMLEARQSRADAADQHAAELTERRVALEAEIRLRRLEQLDRVTDVLLDLRDTVAQEDRHRIPSALNRLAVTLRMLEELGGPTINEASSLGAGSFGAGDKPEHLTGSITTALAAVEVLARNDPRLKLQADAERPQTLGS